MTETARNEESNRRRVLHRDAIRVLDHPALVDSSAGETPSGTSAISVVPLMDQARIAGFEIKCGCGNAAVVECVYPPTAPAHGIPATGIPAAGTPTSEAPNG